MTGPPWPLGRMAAFDLETTGVDTAADRIVTAHVALVGGGQPTLSRSWTVNPGIPIPAGATAIHGITDEHVTEHGEPARDAVAAIAGTLATQLAAGVPVVGWNVVYDLSLLDAELRRHGLQTLAQRLGGEVRPVIDGMVLDKAMDRWRRKTVASRRLVDAARYYGVDLGEDAAHGAAADAMAAVRTVYKITRKYAGLVENYTLDQIHDAQVLWAEDQANRFQEWKRQTEPEFVVERGWPLYLTAVAS